MSESITIGIDHGYAAMKTAHFSFPTGLVAYEHEPYTRKDVLEYGGKYYVVGSGRQPLQKDKTATEDYYLLTLAAIAKELAYRQAERTASVHLAAGLPLTSFGRDKKGFRDYLLRGGKPVSFRYDGLDYLVRLIEGTPVKARPSQEVKELRTEIHHIGNNINQIARSVNAGIASKEDAKRGLYLLDQVYELMYQVANQ